MSFSLSLFANPWTAARQASLSITNPWSLLKLKAIELVMPSNRFIFCHPLLFLPSIFPRIRVFSNKSVSRIRIIGAMKIKTTMRYHYISNRMDKRNKTNHTKCWWICRTVRILMWTEWGGRITNKSEDTSEGDGHGHYLKRDDDSIVVYIYQNLLNCMF